jgi:hypothetical protein
LASTDVNRNDVGLPSVAAGTGFDDVDEGGARVVVGLAAAGLAVVDDAARTVVGVDVTTVVVGAGAGTSSTGAAASSGVPSVTGALASALCWTVKPMVGVSSRRWASAPTTTSATASIATPVVALRRIGHPSASRWVT